MGFRNAIKGEEEKRTRRKYELEELLMDRKIELQRLKSEHESLEKVEADQQQLIHSLLTMEPLS